MIVIKFLITSGVFLVLDGLWLGLVAKRFYQDKMGHLMAAKPNFFAAGIFYVIYIIALLHFVILPASEKGNVVEALWRGALFGLAMYATYDLTNLATLKDFPLVISVVDIIWGTLVTGVTATLATLIIKSL